MTHGYYSDGRCPDFVVTPDAATAKLFRNHRCVLRPRADGLAVYVPVESDTSAKPFIAFADNRVFSFNLRLCNTEFPLYTDYTDLPNNYGFRLNAEESAPSAPFATIDIPNDFNPPASPPADIKISFNAQQLRWAYYLVADQTHGKDFAIIDGLGKTAFQQSQPQSEDRVAATLAGQYPNATVLRFISNEAIPCREIGTDKIQLWLGKNQIIESLPNPSYRNFLQLDPETGPKAADAIFQIVNYITNSTLMKG
ncbi:hypothetical protein [Methylogaea oryzae]|uniref:hypothetical protein n=1 Tax=Methylogaea oryzae TaxID=1295382 RepID=UPI0012E0DF7A|nr:hypothetical protein [Methylogaea oryzae]